MLVLDATDYTEGVRRSRRTKYAPLEWWRLEKVVYGRRDSGVSMVPVIKDIIRIPKEPSKPLGVKGTTRRHSRPPRSKREDDETHDQEIMVLNPEEGWDDKTDPHGIVLDYVTQMEVKRRASAIFLPETKFERVQCSMIFRCRIYCKDGDSQTCSK